MSTLIHDKGLDPIGIALGFGERGYHRFHSASGIGGLAKWVDGRLDILVVYSDQPGHGNFRKFITRAKSRYQIICLWHICNPDLEAALKRYGFTPETEVQGDGEILEGMRWDRKVKAKP